MVVKEHEDEDEGEERNEGQPRRTSRNRMTNCKSAIVEKGCNAETMEGISNGCDVVFTVLVAAEENDHADARERKDDASGGSSGDGGVEARHKEEEEEERYRSPARLPPPLVVVASPPLSPFLSPSHSPHCIDAAVVVVRGNMDDDASHGAFSLSQ